MSIVRAVVRGTDLGRQIVPDCIQPQPSHNTVCVQPSYQLFVTLLSAVCITTQFRMNRIAICAILSYSNIH